MSELVREVEETGLNVQELLNSLDNDENCLLYTSPSPRD